MCENFVNELITEEESLITLREIKDFFTYAFCELDRQQFETFTKNFFWQDLVYLIKGHFIAKNNLLVDLDLDDPIDVLISECLGEKRESFTESTSIRGLLEILEINPEDFENQVNNIPINEATQKYIDFVNNSQSKIETLIKIFPCIWIFAELHIEFFDTSMVDNLGKVLGFQNFVDFVIDEENIEIFKTYSNTINEITNTYTSQERLILKKIFIDGLFLELEFYGSLLSG